MRHTYPREIMQIGYIYGKIKGYRRLKDMHYSLKRYEKSEVAKQRLKIIRFYREYGEKATKEAFGCDRKVINRWQRRMKEHSGMLCALVPYSTRPKKLRESKVPYQTIEYIRELRLKHPRLGKEKIKIFLDKYCEEAKIHKYSASTIGNIIKRNNYFYQISGRVYHNPDSKWAQRPFRHKKRLRIKHSPKVTDYGHILSDTVERITDGVKSYFYSAIDARGKFAVTLNYKTLTSRHMKDFYERFKTVYPLKIKCWQTDNGSEHLGEFELHLKKEGIAHLFSYPRCPKINSFIERYNRTIQEEFIDNNEDIIHDKQLFNKALSEYLLYYNIERPHLSLNLLSPLQYLIKNDKMSHMSLTYTTYSII